MTPKAKRKREKLRTESQATLIRAAALTPISPRATVESYQYNDGMLIHRVMRDHRSFNQNAGRIPKECWVTRWVLATRCGRVIAVGSAPISKSSKAPNCIRCVTPDKNWYVMGIEWTVAF